MWQPSRGFVKRRDAAKAFASLTWGSQSACLSGERLVWALTMKRYIVLFLLLRSTISCLGAELSVTRTLSVSMTAGDVVFDPARALCYAVDTSDRALLFLSTVDGSVLKQFTFTNEL